MKILIAVLLAACTVPVSAQWNYSYNPRTNTNGSPPNNFNSSQTPTDFTTNGTVTYGQLGAFNDVVGPLTPSQYMQNSNQGVAYSLILKNLTASPSGGPVSAAEYEVSSVLRIQGNGGHFIQYVRSSQTALSSATVQNVSYFLVDLANPTFTASGCMATLNFWQDLGNAAGGELKASAQVPCGDHMVMRTVVLNAGQSSYVWTLINGQIYSAYCDLLGGSPGIGMLDAPNTNGIESAQFGTRSLIAPAPVDRITVGTSSFPDHIDMHWTDPLDVTGVGLLGHGIFRNNAFLTLGFLGNNYTDDQAAPNTTYSYQISTTSYHNIGSASQPFNATTTSPSLIDPRRVGVRQNGSYWGAMGENIDNLSGNLNLSIPLLQAKARGGWGVSFSLSYNSQMWRQDNAGTWLRGQDVGYGLGWSLMAGSLTPVWNDEIFSIDHYIFTNATGAEYKLVYNPSNPFLWVSKDSLNIVYDTSSSKLRFPNGSFWFMGEASSGEEQDAGTYYPTVMQDKNGNQIVLTYDAGRGTNYYNSSARILTISDIRSVTPTYIFHYEFVGTTLGDNVMPHLTYIYSNVPTGESYAFYRASGVALTSPFASDSYGNVDLLQSVVGAVNRNNAADANAPQRTYGFYYNVAGEMTQANLPTGGYLRWDQVTSNPLGNGRTQREVANRYLVQDAPGQGTRAEVAYHISHESSTATVHNTTNIVDPTNATKIFQFCDGASYCSSTSNLWEIGLLHSLQKRPSIYAANVESTAVTWLLSTTGNPYPSTVQVITDGVQSSQTQQQVDGYGNVTLQYVWDYGATSASRRYRYDYLHIQNPAYASFFITNALTAKYVGDGSGGNEQFLGGISYDTQGGACPDNVTAIQPDPAITAPLHDPLNRNIFLGNPMAFITPGQGYSCKSYDAAGNVIHTEGPGNPGTQVNYDASTNFSAPTNASIISDSAASLSSFTYTPWLTLSTYSGPNGATGTYRYDDFAQPLAVTLTTGGTVNFAQYPGQMFYGGQTQSIYPAAFFPSSTFSNRYPFGQLSYIDGHYTRKTLDGLGRIVREERGATIPNSLGAPTSVVDTQYGPCACSPVGKMIKQSQPYAPGDPVYWMTYTYDAMGRTVKVTSPDGSPSTITYNTTAPNTAAPPSLGQSVTTVDAKGKWKIVISDIFDNVKQVTEPDPASSGTLGTFYTYNQMNQLTQVSMPRNGYNQTRTMIYDPTSFVLTSETHPENGTTQYMYHTYGYNQLRLWIRQDAKNQQIKVEDTDYDRYNRPLRRKFLTNSTGAEDICQQINYTYDTYPAGADNFYGGWGHLTSSKVGPGDTTAACAAVTLPDGSRYNQTFQQTFGYTPTGQINKKRLNFSQTLTTNDGTQIAAPGGQWDTSYTYDDEGYQTSTTYPSGLTHNIGLDFMKRPYSLTSFKPGQNIAGPIIDSVLYNAADQMTQTSWPANDASQQGGGGRDYDATGYLAFTETRAYNSLNQLAQIQTQIGGPANGANGVPVLTEQPKVIPSGVDLNYRYTAGINNGQVDSLASGLDTNFNATYTYDALKRLQSVTNSGSGYNQTFAYDGFGNMTYKSGGNGFTVNMNPATNQPTGNLCYDANGNLISLTYNCAYIPPNAPDYGYDIQNRLVYVAVSSNGATDNSGHVDKSAEKYVYTADNKRVSTVRPNGNVEQVIYVYGIKNEITSVCTIQIIGQAPACGPGDLKFAGRVIRQNAFPVTVDRLGSVVGGPNGVRSGFGVAPTRYYLPYGEQWNTQTAGPAFPGNFSFASYFRDQSTGLDYADHRFYNSTNGFSRFMTADPSHRAAKATNSGSWNKYSYVEGDPINKTDTLGLWSDPDDGLGGCYWDDVYEEWVCLPGGGGYGPGGPNPGPGSGGETDFLGRDETDARNDLGKSNCYKLLGFLTAKEAQSAFDTIRFNYASYGKLNLQNGVPTQDPAPANTLGYGVININTDYNFGDFSKVSTQQGGTFNYLSFINTGLGTNLNSEQLGTLIIIHELGHQQNWPKQPSDAESVAEKRAIYDNCIK